MHQTFRCCPLSWNIKKNLFCCKIFKKKVWIGCGEILSALFCKTYPFCKYWMLPQYSRLGPDNTWIIFVVNKITWFFSFLNNVWLWKLKFDLSRIINLNTDLADLQKNICWNRDMLHFLTFWVEGGYPPKVAIFFQNGWSHPPPSSTLQRTCSHW